MFPDLLAFADDFVIRKPIRNQSDVEALQRETDQLSEAIAGLGLSLNANKCCSMTFSHHPQPISTPVSVNGEDIATVTETKYLGVIIDRRLSFAQHTDFVCQRARRAIGTLVRQFRGAAPNYVIDKVYQTCVLPQMTYAVQCWYPRAACHQKKLENVQRYAGQQYTNKFQIQYPELLQTASAKSGHIWLPIWKFAAIQRLWLFYNYYHNLRYAPRQWFPSTADQGLRRSCRINAPHSIATSARTDASKGTFIFALVPIWNSLPHDVVVLSPVAFRAFVKSDQCDSILLQHHTPVMPFIRH